MESGCFLPKMFREAARVTLGPTSEAARSGSRLFMNFKQVMVKLLRKTTWLQHLRETGYIFRNYPFIKFVTT